MHFTRRKVDGTAARALVERTRNAQLTYAPVGISLGWQPVPDGFRDVVTERVVGQGEDEYRKIGYALMHWEVNRRAGFQVQPQHNSVRIEPMSPMFPVAPIAFLRGNHEDCGRAGNGFFLYLDPHPH